MTRVGQQYMPQGIMADPGTHTAADDILSAQLMVKQ